MNEFEAHESSYDHQHKKRLKDMKEMQKQVQNAGRKEEKGPLMTIKLGSSSNKTAGGGGFKKGGFKNAFGPVDDGTDSVKKEDEDARDEPSRRTSGLEEGKQLFEDDSDMTDDDDYYDPRKPTGCTNGCAYVSPT